MNLKTPLTLLFAAVFAQALSAQVSFTNRTNLLKTNSVRSGAAMAVADMNGDGLDDIVRMNQTHDLRIEYQTSPNQPFETRFVEQITPEEVWGIAVADMDNNGYPDVLSAGKFNSIYWLYANATGTGYQKWGLFQPNLSGQTVNFADLDADGRLDGFVSNSRDLSRIFKNTGGSAQSLQSWPSPIPLATSPTSDNSGANASVWTDVDNDCDVDLYLVRQHPDATDPSDPRRINQLFLNNGDGTFTQDVTNASGLRIGAQSWAADFGDIDNDGDMDCFLLNSGESSQLLENDGAGHFTDITAQAVLKDSILGTSLQGIFRDFDNNGWIDIFISGSRPYLFLNNGDKTFSKLDSLPTCNPVQTLAIGDLNSDGYLDYYAGYPQAPNLPTTQNDAMFFHNGGKNHWFGVALRGVASNRNGVGARITVHTKDGIQIRDVRAGEGFGISHSLKTLFGLGKLTAIDSVTVCWPSGQVDVVPAPGIDQYVTIQEGGCLAEAVELAVSDVTTFCSGDSVVLTAPPGFTYQWNTGATGEQITVKASGNYNATVTNAGGCTSVSNTVRVVVDPDETPTIQVEGDSVICAGFSVILSADKGTAWQWSTGSTEQAISVSAAGSYTVTAQGLCQKFTSAPVHVRVIEPALPVAVGDTVWPGFKATLTGTGQELHWFDAEIGGNKLYIGNPFVTPPLTQTTQFWVANNRIEDQQNEFLGPKNHAGTNGPENFNGAVIFEAYRPFRLKSVKVYSMANVPKEREIELFNEDGEEIAKRQVSIPVGESRVTLNFDVPAGDDFVLTTGENVNIQNFGVVGPLLRRSDVGISYPYEIEDAVEILGSNAPANPEGQFYYFYDWEIDFLGHYCLSDRVPVTALVGTDVSGTGSPSDAPARLFLSPNPASDVVSVSASGFADGDISLKIMDLQGRTLRQQTTFLPENGTARLDLMGLPAGIYFVEMTDGERAARGKLVRE
ncbi:MAG: FG-GAP-like repeat-containing protein [Saprospiraceae bacterium]